MNSNITEESSMGSNPETVELETVSPGESALPEEVDLKDPSLYINRELSLLQFQGRVLAQAKIEQTPLLERLRFLCISSTNLDEFFEIRVAGLKHKSALGSGSAGADGLKPNTALAEISHEAHALVEEQYRVLNDVLLPELEKQGVLFLKRAQWTEEQALWIEEFFKFELVPMLSPLGLDTAHPFPRVLNKSLNFIVTLKGKDAFGRDSGTAIVQAPRSLSRLIKLPSTIGGSEYCFVFLSSVIHAHVGKLFPGMTVTGCHQFRVTRDCELFVDDEESDDLMRSLKGEINARRLGDTVRLEVADNCTIERAQFLLNEFKLNETDLYQVNGPVNLNRLLSIYDMVDRPDLKYPSLKPGCPKRLSSQADLFQEIRASDVLLHHPFQSFMPVLNLIRQAARDPNVLAIKQTLYRTGVESPLVKALIEAARADKEVTIIIELRARFDEEANIELATRLQDAGAHVVYGVVGHKTHAKMLLIVRREGGSFTRYVHLGTGNYHVTTAKFYTDFGLLTCDKVFGEDVHKLFMQLTGLGRTEKLQKMLQAPFSLHKTLMKLIEAEGKQAEAGNQARIIAKINSLVEPKIIRALYRASQAGVKIELIVRGACCLRPGLPGVSDNISVRSIVGRFLEHTRIFYFYNQGEPKVYCSSADWMDRNFFRRVETCFPIEDKRRKDRVINEGLLPYLSDNTQAWLLQSDGRYTHLTPDGAEPKAAQTWLLEQLSKIKSTKA